MTATTAQLSLLVALSHNQQPCQAHVIGLASKVLAPDESVMRVEVGDPDSDSNPVLVVTDRRIFVAKERWLRGWKVTGEIPAAQVARAEHRPRFLSGKLTVIAHDGSEIALTTGDNKHAQATAAWITELARRA